MLRRPPRSPRPHTLFPNTTLFRSALDPRRVALEIARVLAVELDEGGAIIHRLRLGRDLAEKVGGADVDAAVAADMQLVPAVDADDAEILDRRLGPVAWTARYLHLELVRHPAAPPHPFDLDREPGRSLRADAAPFALNAHLHGAQRLARP